MRAQMTGMRRWWMKWIHRNNDLRRRSRSQTNPKRERGLILRRHRIHDRCHVKRPPSLTLRVSEVSPIGLTPSGLPGFLSGKTMR